MLWLSSLLIIFHHRGSVYHFALYIYIYIYIHTSSKTRIQAILVGTCNINKVLFVHTPLLILVCNALKIKWFYKYSCVNIEFIHFT